MHAPLTYTGRLVDADTGAGLDGAIVATMYDQALTDENGYFSLITDELDGPWMIRQIGYESQSFGPFDTAENIDMLTDNGRIPLDVGTLKMVRDESATTYGTVEVSAERPKKNIGIYGILIAVAAAALIASDE